MEFTGKTAIITGGASGMGAATARLFAKRGGIPLIVDRNEPLARAVAAEIGADEPLCGDARRLRQAGRGHRAEGADHRRAAVGRDGAAGRHGDLHADRAR